MTKLLQLWRGELSLFDAFWNRAVIGGLAVNAATSEAGLLRAVAGDAPGSIWPEMALFSGPQWTHLYRPIG